MTERRYNELQSVARACDVLLAFLKADEWTVSGLSRQLGLHKSVTHRLLTTLAGSGLLAKDSRSGLYRLGPTLANLGRRAERNTQMMQVARPHLHWLAQETGETVSLAVLQGDHGLCVDVVESPHSMRFTVAPGHSFPLHAGCVGKVILAFQPEDFIDRLLSKTPLQRYTDSTITDPDALRREFARIRSNGFGFSDSEITPGARSIGAPIYAQDGTVIASLTISAPAARMPEPRVQQWALMLRQASGAISTALGYRDDAGEGRLNAV